MTDPAKTGEYKNLTIYSLPALIPAGSLKNEMTALCNAAQSEAAFARDHRNKRIAHQDHDHANQISANHLSGISRERVEAMLSSLRSVLNSINQHYRKSTTLYEEVIFDNDAAVLVQKLRILEKHLLTPKSAQ